MQANVGDSRAVASVRGHAQLLSFDHKPNHEREMKRIKAAGGFVEFNRVNGNLALSRALGDFNFKKNEHRSAEEQIVTGRLLVNLIVELFVFKRSYSYEIIQNVTLRTYLLFRRSKPCVSDWILSIFFRKIV